MYIYERRAYVVLKNTSSTHPDIDLYNPKPTDDWDEIHVENFGEGKLYLFCDSCNRLVHYWDSDGNENMPLFYEKEQDMIICEKCINARHEV